MLSINKAISRVGSKKQKLHFQIKVVDLTVIVSKTTIVAVKIVRGDGPGHSYCTEQFEVDHITWGNERH